MGLFSAFSRKSEFEKNMEAAARGDGEAAYKVGEALEFGKEVPKDLDKALEYYELSAELKYPKGINVIGVFYRTGQFYEKDDQKATEYYRRAAEMGNGAAACNLGLAYEYGRGVEKDIKKAVYWYKIAAERNNARGFNCLAVLYENGDGVEKDQDKANELYAKAVELGNPYACANLGCNYEFGYGFDKDVQKAVELYKKGAERGNARSMYLLGEKYEYGFGVPKSQSEALKFYSSAAELGYDNAIEARDRLESGEASPVPDEINERFFIQGCRYFVHNRYADAFPYLKTASEAGSSYAMYLLGLEYSNGDGVEKDLEKGYYWAKKSAELGSLAGLYLYAQFQMYGVCCQKDVSAGLDSLLKSFAGLVEGLEVTDGGSEKALDEWFSDEEFKKAHYGHYLRYRELKAQSDPKAARELADYYYNNKRYKDAYKAYAAGADRGFHDMAERAAMLACLPKYNINDIKNGIHYFELAADRGSGPSMYNAGLIYLQGRGGIEKDYEKARKYLSMAYKEGSYSSEDMLAKIYDKGLGTAVDHEKATEILLKGAQRGHADAMRMLGTRLDEGIYVEKNLTEALKWYQKALDKGDESVKKRIGDIKMQSYKDTSIHTREDDDYLRGMELFKAGRYEEAFPLIDPVCPILFAKKNQYPEGQAAMGYMRENGCGCEKSEDIAFLHYKIAAKNGNTDGKIAVLRIVSSGPIKPLESYEDVLQFTEGVEDSRYAKLIKKRISDWRACEPTLSELMEIYDTYFKGGVKASQELWEKYPVIYHALGLLKPVHEGRHYFASLTELGGTLYDGTELGSTEDELLKLMEMASYFFLVQGSPEMGWAIYQELVPMKHIREEEGYKAHMEHCLSSWGVYSYYTGRYKEAFSLLKESRDFGSVLSSYYLGLLYEQGKGVEPDIRTAREYFLKAAEKYDHVEAESLEAKIARCDQYLSGEKRSGEECYLKAKLYPPNVSIDMYKKAAEEGCLKAYLDLAVFCAYGVGVEKDDKRSMELLNAYVKEDGDFSEALGPYLDSSRSFSQLAQRMLDSYPSLSSLQRDLLDLAYEYMPKDQQGEYIASMYNYILNECWEKEEEK